MLSVMNYLVSFGVTTVIASLVVLFILLIGSSIGGHASILTVHSRMGLGLGALLFGLWATQLGKLDFLFSLVGLAFFFTVLYFVRFLWIDRTPLQTPFLSPQLIAVLVAVGTAMIIAGNLWIGSARAGAPLGTATLGNNDVANYLLSVKAVLASGLGGYSETWIPISNSNYSFFAREANPGATLFMAVFAPVAGVIGSFTNSAYVAAFAVQWFGALGLATALAGQGKKLANWQLFLIVSATQVTSFNIYVSSHGFLAQILGVAGMLGILGSLIRLTTNQTSLRDALLGLGGWQVVVLLSYATIALPVAAFTLVWLLILVALDLKTGEGRKSGPYFASVAVPMILLAPHIPKLLKTFFSQAGAAAGWPLPGVTASAAIWDFNRLSLEANNTLAIASWILFVFTVVFAVLMARDWNYRWRWSLAIALLFSSVAVALALVRFGWGSYQGWKLISWLLPALLIVFALALFSTGISRVSERAVGALFLSILIVATSSLTPVRAVTSQDLLDIRNHQALWDVESLNIQLGPSFETMIAGAMAPVESVSLSSPTYVAEDIDFQTCTLVGAGNPLFGLPNTIGLNDSYGLAQWPRTCSGEDSPIATIDSHSNWQSVSGLSEARTQQIFILGWHDVEPWGIWSQEDAVMALYVERVSGPTSTLFIEFEAIGAPGHVVRLESDIDATEIDVSKGGTFRASLAVQNEMLVTLKIENSVTVKPADTIAGSLDTRSLGIGVTRIRVSD
jgi:hypothetical protein